MNPNSKNVSSLWSEMLSTAMSIPATLTEAYLNLLRFPESAKVSELYLKDDQFAFSVRKLFPDFSDGHYIRLNVGQLKRQAKERLNDQK